MDTEFAIVGGGVVGLSIAYGLLNHGHSVSVLDEGDGAYRASRGNFGLIWVQGKGLKQPAYTRWTRASAAAWKDLAEQLTARTGEDLSLVQDGGYVVHMDEDALDADRKKYETLQAELGGDYPFEVMGRNALRSEEPNIGPKVAGALYCREDGHVNPLRLLRTLSAEVRHAGGDVRVNTQVKEIAGQAGGYRLIMSDGSAFGAEKVVLAAGLGALQLGPGLGFRTPISPQQGQVLITEKLPKLMNRPNVEVRQVDEGGVQIGASSAELGFDDRETLETTAALARNAVDMYPALRSARVLRSWAALRIMSPDGLPIYQQSPTHPGVFFVTCHSGVTLAAAHARFLPLWLTGQTDAPDLSMFSEERFRVQAA
ncbi:MAG: FAD-binding oxidoreductase [Alphaproteobacteria bacterium]|nr:FAD-binding oxidoreductase [Alphaproteobacteria bacterium]